MLNFAIPDPKLAAPMLRVQGDGVGLHVRVIATVNATSLTTAPSIYTVQNANETLQTIAKTVWGDSKLWYLIADANAIGTASAPLTAGQLIKLPARINTINNNAQTFKPYDPSKLIGATTPNLPQVPAVECGGYGQIIVTVVAIVVAAVVTYASLGTASGAAAEFVAAVEGAAAGNIAGQVVGNAIGVQDGFSFKSLALSVVSAGVTQGVAPLDIGTIGRAALGNAITQGIGVVTGLQKSFDWRSVVASGIGAGVGETVGGALADNGILQGKDFGSSFARGAVTGFAAGVGTAVARGGRVSVVQVTVDSFGNALGNAIAGNITTQTVSERQAKGGSFTTVPLNLSEPGFTALSFTAPASSGTGDVIDNFSNQAQGFGENPNAPQRSLTSYVAQRRDTLSGITGGDLAQVGLIANANGLRGSAIQSGQQLIIPDIGDYTGQQQNAFARVGGQIYAGDNAVIAARQAAAAEREAGYLRDPATGEIASFADLSRRSRAASDAADNASAGAARDRINSLAAASGQQLVPYDPVARAYAEQGTVNRLNTALLGPFGLGGALARFNGQDENSIAQVNEVGNAAFGVVAAVAGIPSSGPISVAPRSFNGSFIGDINPAFADGAGAANNTVPRSFTTKDPGVGPIIDAIENHAPGTVRQAEIQIFRPDGTAYTDFDIVTDTHVIQVKIGGGKGIVGQIQTSQGLTDLDVIGFDANNIAGTGQAFKPSVLNNAKKNGITIVNNIDDLLRTLGKK
jgi:LysM repeat protein